MRCSLTLHAAGLPSQSIQWGPWATGMAASNPRIGQTFQQAGISLLAPAEGLRLLQRVLQCSCSAPVLAAHVQWPQLLSRQQALPAIFSEVAALDQSSQQRSRLLAAQSDLQQQVQQPAAATQVQPMMSVPDARQLLKQTLHQMLGHDIAEDEVSVASAGACCTSSRAPAWWTGTRE